MIVKQNYFYFCNWNVITFLNIIKFKCYKCLNCLMSIINYIGLFGEKFIGRFENLLTDREGGILNSI